MKYLKCLLLLLFVSTGILAQNAPVNWQRHFKERFDTYLQEPKHHSLNIVDTLKFIDTLLTVYKNDQQPVPFRPVALMLIKDTTWYPSFSFVYDTGSLPNVVQRREIQFNEVSNFVVLFYIDAILLKRLNGCFHDVAAIYIDNNGQLLYGHPFEAKQFDAGMESIYNKYLTWSRKMKTRSWTEIRQRKRYPLAGSAVKWVIE